MPSAALDILRGVPTDVVWQMHAALPMPTLAVLLTAAEDAAVARIADRGAHSRWQTQVGNTRAELDAYQHAAEHLQTEGWPLLTINTTTASPRDVACTIMRYLHQPIPTPALPTNFTAVQHP